MTEVFTLRGPIKKDRPEPAKRSVTRKSLDGTELASVDLEPTFFGIEPNMAVLHQVIKAQLAAKRSGTQSTKTRKEVRGGGRKPFNQKGTGGARQGTIRAGEINAYDVLDCDWILFTDESLPSLKENS